MTFAQSGEQIGIVLVTKGLVQARSATGEIRTLTRRDVIYQNDTILIGTDGMTQVRMSDDALFAFKAETEFTFNDYQYDGDAESADSAVMSMVRGGFRTISGSIGDADEDTYRIDTPMASIGIRGTTHAAMIVDNSLFTGVSVGGTTISNNAGNIDTGLGGDFDFSETLLGNAPAGLLFEPELLNQVDFAVLQAATPNNANNAAGNVNPEPAANFAAPANNAVANAVAIASSASLTQPVNNPDSNINPLINSRQANELITDSGGVLPPPRPGNDNSGNNGNGNNQGNNGSGNDPGNGNNQGNNGNGNGNNSGNNGNGSDSGNGNNQGNNGNGNEPGNGNNQGNNGNGNNSGNNNAGNDPGTGTTDPGNNDPDPGTSTGGGTGTIPGTSGSVGGSNPPKPGNTSNPPKPTTATASALTENTSGYSAAIGTAPSEFVYGDSARLAIAWDTWNRTTLPGQHSEEIAPADLLDSVFQPANIAGMTGTANFAGSMFQGTDETGRDLQDVRFGFTVDFAGGANAITNGSLQIVDSDSGHWDVTFDGALRGSDVLMHNITGTFDAQPAPVTGNIDGFFTTINGSHSFAGGFAVEAGSDFAQGVLIVDEVNNPDR